MKCYDNNYLKWQQQSSEIFQFTQRYNKQGKNRERIKGKDPGGSMS